MHIKGLAHGSSNRWQAISHAAGCTKNISTSCDPFDPRDIWALQSSFGELKACLPCRVRGYTFGSETQLHWGGGAGISESVMIGWWAELEEGHEYLPVTSSVEDVKVTTYLRKVRPPQTACIHSGQAFFGI